MLLIFHNFLIISRCLYKTLICVFMKRPSYLLLFGKGRLLVSFWYYWADFDRNVQIRRKSGFCSRLNKRNLFSTSSKVQEERLYTVLLTNLETSSLQNKRLSFYLRFNNFFIMSLFDFSFCIIALSMIIYFFKQLDSCPSTQVA